MDLKSLRKQAERARSTALQEKIRLVEAVVTIRAAMAEDQLQEKLHRTRIELEQRTQRAAQLGHGQTILVSLSAGLYDLTQACLEELSKNPEPYPQLRREGPYRYGDIEGWLRDDIGWPDPERASPVGWMDELARWVIADEEAGKLKRILRGRPPLHGELQKLYAECKSQGLKPTFQLYERMEERGLNLLVTWLL